MLEGSPKAPSFFVKYSIIYPTVEQSIEISMIPIMNPKTIYGKISSNDNTNLNILLDYKMNLLK